MLIVFASSFRILVTFALVLEVRGISFFQIPWTTYDRSLLDQKITIRVLLRSSPFINRDSASPTSLHGLSGRNMLNLVRILIYASTTQKVICSFELSLFSCLLTFVYQLIVKSMRAFVCRCLFLLWPVKPFRPEWLGETNSSTSSISRIGSKQLYSADQSANPAFDSVQPLSIALFMSGIS